MNSQLAPAIELPNTAINTLSLYETSGNHNSTALVWNMTDNKSILVISVVSDDQKITKAYLCANRSNGSKVEEVSSEMLQVFKNSMDEEFTSFISIKVKYIKKLVLRADDGEGSSNQVYLDISISFPE